MKSCESRWITDIVASMDELFSSLFVCYSNKTVQLWYFNAQILNWKCYLRKSSEYHSLSLPSGPSWALVGTAWFPVWGNSCAHTPAAPPPGKESSPLPSLTTLPCWTPLGASLVFLPAQRAPEDVMTDLNKSINDWVNWQPEILLTDPSCCIIKDLLDKKDTRGRDKHCKTVLPTLTVGGTPTVWNSPINIHEDIFCKTALCFQ